MKLISSAGRLALALATAATLLSSAPATAEERREEARFDLEIRGLRMGQLAYAAVEDGRSYAISGRVETSGLAGLLRKLRYEAKVTGRLSGGRFAPQRYEQSGGSGDRTSRETVVWTNGLPRITSREPARSPQPGDADPARQRGTVDTLTTIYATLRDVAPDQACRGGVVMFDGRYRMELQLSSPQPGERGGLVCSGAYVRREGFTAEEMSERVSFPFTLHYAPLSDGRLRVTEVRMDSLYGRARLVRR